ncbi:sensor histidine kinase [Jannaschia aquimarina]|uniref:histidine kinase n=1 Tax=Jannaschia aquimarina TaxID=935700 RepID=A0A0D1EL55_9RHOB|nr:ATP-binding protein [Jannaschia aquimarina]KIT17706.1 Signal transduction histidine-protein kinase BarA [Jannaschia aquimarina]SNS78567.1 Signal transduction histidine kinase [Jannaschia aquimarina]
MDRRNLKDPKRLRRHVLLALAVLLLPMFVVSAASIEFHRTAAIKARYVVALSQLVEAMARIDGHVARIEAQRDRVNLAVRASLTDAVGLYGAIRAADPDGDEILEGSESAKREALSALTAALGVEPVSLSRELGLFGNEMPDELVEIWEEDEAWTSASSMSPSLEATFAGIILAAAPVILEDRRDAATLDAYWEASGKLSDVQHVEVVETLQDGVEVASRAPLFLAIGVLGVALGGAAAAWVFVAKPLIQEVSRSQAALAHEAEAAQAADRAKSEFLSTVSHELRTPMNGIIGAVQLLEHSDLSAEDGELLEILASCAESQMTLIEEILTFGEVEADALRIVEEPIEISEIIRESTGFATIGAGKKGVSLTVQMPEAAPSIMGDPKRLRQVIVNLVGNAVKFTDEGSVEVRATLEEDGERPAFRVRVADTGSGIPPEYREKIFERFTQADSSSSRKAGGTGLGLAIARGLAREMGGDITMTSELGKGSIFVFEIPTRLADQSETGRFNEKEAA